MPGQLFPILALSLSVLCQSQRIGAQSQHPVSLGFEFQAYPTGLIPGLRLDYHFKSHHSVHMRAGYNWVRHRDLGVQDHEEGDGFGGTLGYRYYFRNGWTGWFGGARCDLWRNQLDWQDKDDNGVVIADGTSRIMVLQPTAEAGYLLLLGKSPWFLAPSIAFGVEVNVKTEGAPVGEGTILLLGICLGKRF